MSRWRRVLIELLGPPPVATSMLALLAIAREPGGPWSWEHLGGFLALLAFAYLFAAIPCVIFTLALEAAFSRGLPPGSGATVWLAAALGLLSGAGMAGFAGAPAAFEWMPILGLLTGAAIGAFIRWRSRRAAYGTPVGSQQGDRLDSPS